MGKGSKGGGGGKGGGRGAPGRQGAGWPSKTSNPSGGGRNNAPPRSGKK